MPPSLIERSEYLLAQLLTVPPMMDASAAKDWHALDAAINAAKAAKVSENTIKPYLREMLQLRAAARLAACLAKGEDGYPELQACYDAALAAELDGDDVAEAKRILEALKDAQRSFHGAFERSSGGSKELIALSGVIASRYLPWAIRQFGVEDASVKRMQQVLALITPAAAAAGSGKKKKK